MNVIFAAQGVGLKIFHNLLKQIRTPLNIKDVGCYVAHSMFYDKFVKEHPDVEYDYILVKEWEIIKKSRLTKPDLNKIKEYEKIIGNPTLWEPLICDRRIYLGKMCTARQDYRPSFTHEEMLSILQVALERLEGLLSRVKPNVILSLDPVNFGEYLLYLFAAYKGIPMLFFRSTKIKNYVAFDEGIFGCSPHIHKLFQEYKRGDFSDQWKKEANNYLDKTEKEDIRYEGMIPIPSKKKGSRPKNNYAFTLMRGIKSEIDYLLWYRNDISVRGIWGPFFYKRFIFPFKAKLYNWRYGSGYVTMDQLEMIDYAFYPLQSEPEIASLIWGKSYMNQIETIRNIARSLPVGTKLLVKEHPRSLGYRSSRYYKKILEIPNVLLIHPDTEVRPIIKNARIVITIAGFVAFEAVIYRVPAIMLGGPRPFCILPDSMIRYVNSINDLAFKIEDLMKNYEYKRKHLVDYIAAMMRGSVAVDFFTVLLSKKGRYEGDGSGKFEKEIEKMGAYTVKRVKEVLEHSSLAEHGCQNVS